MNCSEGFQAGVADLSSQGTDLTPEQELVLEGKVLYEANCAACHGPLEGSTKHDVSAAQILNAIAFIPNMKDLDNLKPREIDAIAAALSADGPSDEDLACESAPDVGAVAMHRLNQTEYRNTIRSLTGVNLSPDVNFPTEEVAEFNNTASNLKLSPQQVSWYLETAISVVNSVVDTQSLRVRFYDCNLATAACWKGAIKNFADKAYRRPATTNELTRVEGLYSKIISESGTADVAIRTAFQAILVSPQFLYRNVEMMDPNNKDLKQKLNGYELAARISYFVWGDQPDATLVQKALAGQLSQKETLATEIDRLLADDRAAVHLGENFLFYWLGLQGLATHTVSATSYPEFNATLRNDMANESKMFFKDFVATNQPLSQILTADYSFLNQNLANFYGIAGVTGNNMRKVSLAGTNRTGALTHGSLMTVTSHATSTSIVRRGGFIALNLQCISVQAPPDGVGTPPPPNGKDSIRDRLEAHRSNPQCIGCHKIMDPPGFGLENFNAIGKSRTLDDEGFALDTTGQLYNGKKFNNAIQLADLLGEDRTFNRCGVRKMTTFALGRTLQAFDDCTMEKITNNAGTKSLKEIIAELILSDPFQYERGG